MTQGHPPGRRNRVSAFLRSFAIQGSWNYRTLVGGGVAYALLPMLRSIHAGDPVALRESLERNASSFNGHPYLCAMAVGALARLELEGRDPVELERFRSALAGPLGALGDRLVWSGWRPFCLLASALAWAAGWGAPVAVALFLGLYNLGHLALRAWAFRTGWRSGFEVGAALRRAPLGRAAEALLAAVVPLLGAAAAALALRAPGAGTMAAGLAAAAAATAAYLVPRLGERVAVPLLAAATLLWMA